ncbi:replication initiation protein [Carnobacterium maltaromaticum]|uniref:replication initiation protein n=1 Tax=Carnobacterium maltaromaticum TaxID=2751 RepID=UPI0039BE7C28
MITISNNVVRYNNGLNGVALRTFSPVDMDLFWTICSKMKRKGTNQEVFSFAEIREIAKYNQRGTELFSSDVIRMADRLGGLAFYFEDEHVWERLNLFQRFLVDKDKETLTVKVNEQFEFILNSIGTNFTRFELENMTKLKSSYTKELYRQLMAHRDKVSKRGAWFVRVDDFRDLLAVPQSFRMSNIDKRIFDVAEKEFTQPKEDGTVIFSSFKVEKVKARSGNKISSFKIFFEEKTIVPLLHNYLED